MQTHFGLDPRLFQLLGQMTCVRGYTGLLQFFRADDMCTRVYRVIPIFRADDMSTKVYRVIPIFRADDMSTKVYRVITIFRADDMRTRVYRSTLGQITGYAALFYDRLHAYEGIPLYFKGRLHAYEGIPLWQVQNNLQ